MNISFKDCTIKKVMGFHPVVRNIVANLPWTYVMIYTSHCMW